MILLKKSWLSKLWLGLALALVVSLVAFGSGCKEDGKEGDVEDTIRAVFDAFNAKDVDGFLALFTDAGIATLFDGATREEAAQQLGEFIGEPPNTVREFRSTEVADSTATSEVELASGNIVEIDRFSLVTADDSWLVDNFEFAIASPDIPGGMTAVDLELREFAFVFDPNAIPADGNFAFAGENTGSQQHEIALVMVPADFDLQNFLRPEEELTGELFAQVEDVGFLGPFDPGAQPNVVFTEPLAPGRYAMLCFVEDPATGQAHANLGMLAEFIVPAPAGEATPTEEATP